MWKPRSASSSTRTLGLPGTGARSTSTCAPRGNAAFSARTDSNSSSSVRASDVPLRSPTEASLRLLSMSRPKARPRQPALRATRHTSTSCATSGAATSLERDQATLLELQAEVAEILRDALERLPVVVGEGLGRIAEDGRLFEHLQHPTARRVQAVVLPRLQIEDHGLVHEVAVHD